MKVLVLSFYFQPDLCAGSFRNTAFVKGLKKIKQVKHIDVVSTMPNRYNSYTKSALKIEKDNKVTINRYDIGTHDSGMFDQSISFVKFAFAALKHINGKQYDLIYASSSRLMTGFLGAMISKKMKVPLYIDIRDIFTDTLKELLPKPFAFFVCPPFKMVEKFTINQANKINIVSGGFKTYFEKYFKQKKISIFPNGIDNEFIKGIKGKKPKNSKRIILYAGNIGEGQGLDKILPDLALYLKDWNFNIIGAGSAIYKLRNEIIKRQIKNIHLIAPISRKELIKKYLEADILFLHLNSHLSFEKVLPSKIFEYAATGKPILAGVNGFSKHFINKEIENAVCFEPCNIEKAIKSFNKLRIKNIQRKKFIKNYCREKQMELLVQDVISSLK